MRDDSRSESVSVDETQDTHGNTECMQDTHGNTESMQDTHGNTESMQDTRGDTKETPDTETETKLTESPRTERPETDSPRAKRPTVEMPTADKPTATRPSSDEDLDGTLLQEYYSEVDPAFKKLFWKIVLMVKFGLIGFVLGVLLIVFQGNYRQGGPLAGGGLVLLGYGSYLAWTGKQRVDDGEFDFDIELDEIMGSDGEDMHTDDVQSENTEQ